MASSAAVNFVWLINMVLSPFFLFICWNRRHSIDIPTCFFEAVHKCRNFGEQENNKSKLRILPFAPPQTTQYQAMWLCANLWIDANEIFRLLSTVILVSPKIDRSWQFLTTLDTHGKTGIQTQNSGMNILSNLNLNNTNWWELPGNCRAESLRTRLGVSLWLEQILIYDNWEHVLCM